MMFAKVWLINIVLGAIVFSVTLQAVDVWTQTDTPFPGAIVSDQEKPPVQRRVIPPETEPETAYDLIPEKTLFSEDRAEFVSETAEAEAVTPQVQPSRQTVFLYGVVMVGDYRKALVRDNSGGSGEDRWVREGDTIDKMVVAEIQNDKLLLSSGAEKRVLLLNDPNKPRTSVKIDRKDSPTVVTSNTSALAVTEEGQKEEIIADDKVPSANAEKTIDSKLPKKKENREVAKNQAPEVDKPRIKPQNPLPQLFQMPTDNSTGNRYEVIQTPFGEIKRKIN